MNVSISLCPTDLEFPNGDRYDESKLLDAIRRFVAVMYPEAKITTLQVGHRQGDGWARIDGDDEAGAALMSAFWEAHDDGTDECLFATDEPDDIDGTPGRIGDIVFWCDGKPRWILEWQPSNGRVFAITDANGHIGLVAAEELTRDWRVGQRLGRSNRKSKEGK